MLPLDPKPYVADNSTIDDSDRAYVKAQNKWREADLN
jgi:hypothetical protein